LNRRIVFDIDSPEIQSGISTEEGTRLMPFKNLNTEEMITLSGAWLDAGTEAHAAIVATPELSPSLSRLKDAHNAIKANAQPGARSRITAIIEEEARLDLRYDAIVRGAFGTLTSLAELIGGDDGPSLISLRGTLFPNGLQSQLKTYRAEAGQAQQLSDRMTPELRAQTDAIAISIGPNTKTLSAYIDEFIAIGNQLGALEDEKARLEGDPSRGAELVKARNLWVRVMNAMVVNAELADLDEETEALVFGPLRDAEKKADERARQAAAKAKAAKVGPGKTEPGALHTEPGQEGAPGPSE
jgi:hypothetical protein